MPRGRKTSSLWFLPLTRLLRRALAFASPSPIPAFHTVSLYLPSQRRRTRRCAFGGGGGASTTTKAELCDNSETRGCVAGSVVTRVGAERASSTQEEIDVDGSASGGRTV